jgi:hypothetical protein
MDRSDLSNLTAFVAVADRRSFRAAASQLGVTPSALSHSMRQLEERLGLRLLAQRIGRLNRRPHGVSHFQNALILFERPKSPNMPPSIRLHPTLVCLPRMGYLVRSPLAPLTRVCLAYHSGTELLAEWLASLTTSTTNRSGRDAVRPRHNRVGGGHLRSAQFGFVHASSCGFTP